MLISLRERDFWAHAGGIRLGRPNQHERGDVDRADRRRRRSWGSLMGLCMAADGKYAAAAEVYNEHLGPDRTSPVDDRAYETTE